MSKFDWDDGNREKCVKRVPLAEIEALIDDPRTLIAGDPYKGETRSRAIALTRPVARCLSFFAVRMKGGEMFVRPISARYRHRDGSE